MIPAAIRCKNPGAMWGRLGPKPGAFFATPQGPNGCATNAPIPVKWGSKKTIYLSDGLGQNNNIAIFDDYVSGIAAQIDLWRTSAKYRNKRFADAIATWAGGNNVPSYIALVKAKVPGMTGDTIMNDAFWRGPMAIPFIKAQSSHEAGQQYPAPDADWVEAQRRVFVGSVPVTTKKTATAVATTTTAVVVASSAASQGHGWATIIVLVLVAAVVGGAAWWYFHRKG